MKGRAGKLPSLVETSLLVPARLFPFFKIFFINSLLILDPNRGATMSHPETWHGLIQDHSVLKPQDTFTDRLFPVLRSIYK